MLLFAREVRAGADDVGMEKFGPHRKPEGLLWTSEDIEGSYTSVAQQS
jgi:hypothetical protein